MFTRTRSLVLASALLVAPSAFAGSWSPGKVVEGAQAKISSASQAISKRAAELTIQAVTTTRNKTTLAGATLTGYGLAVGDAKTAVAGGAILIVGATGRAVHRLTTQPKPADSK